MLRWQMTNSITECIQWASDQITRSVNDHEDINTARLDAEVLLASVLEQDRSYLFAWPERKLSQQQWQSFQANINDRVKGKPVAYILGTREFWSLSLKVTPATLIPRPETEQLVDYVLAQHENCVLEVLDAGTGSGAIALALSKERDAWNISACDISDDALAVAQDNANSHNLPVRFFNNSWLSGLSSETYDVIVSNPPYIVDGDEHLNALRYEPQTALVAGDDGLADIKIIALQAMTVLKAGGILYVEHGYNQGDAVKQIFSENGFQCVVCEKDYAGNDRFTHGVKVQES